MSIFQKTISNSSNKRYYDNFLESWRLLKSSPKLTTIENESYKEKKNWIIEDIWHSYELSVYS